MCFYFSALFLQNSNSSGTSPKKWIQKMLRSSKQIRVRADMFMWWEDRQIGFSDAPAGQARRAWMTVTMTDLVGK